MNNNASFGVSTELFHYKGLQTREIKTKAPLSINPEKPYKHLFHRAFWYSFARKYRNYEICKCKKRFCVPQNIW